MVIDVWLLEELKKAPMLGYTLEQLQERWRKRYPHGGELSRTTLFRHRQIIKECFGINITSRDKMHYRISNPEDLKLNTLANELLASLQEYLLIDEFRDLGDKIQPQQIWSGLEFLYPFASALRDNMKVKIWYQKFTDSKPYEAILHPYCLKASQGRWYLLAHKESEDPKRKDLDVQCFALDRMQSIQMLSEKFRPNKKVDVSTYFDNAYGIWVDEKNYPVRDVKIQVTERVAPYLRTLPLHHSQKEIVSSEGWVMFQYHISPTPDFIAELMKWGEEVKILG